MHCRLGSAAGQAVVHMTRACNHKGQHLGHHPCMMCSCPMTSPADKASTCSLLWSHALARPRLGAALSQTLPAQPSALALPWPCTAIDDSACASALLGSMQGTAVEPVRSYSF